MPLTPRPLLTALMLSAALMLAGCESSEEKAERYFLSGMQLLEAGDEDRALVEFRNVFKYNGFHKDARKTYADLVLKRGEINEAYSQYLRLIEQYPDTPEVRQTLAELAITRGDWAEAERHGKAALALTPDVPGVRAIGAALAYRAALLAKDTAGTAIAVKQARDILAEVPGNMIARRMLISDLMAGDDPAAALPEIDLALETEPASLELHVLKFRILAQQNDVPGSGAQLQKMITLFPDNQEVRAALIGWYLVQKDFDGAEAFLRKIAGADDAPAEGHVAVVQLLQAARGDDAALAELDRLIAATTGTPNADLYGALRASIIFTTGDQPGAIAAIEAILAKAAPSEETRRIKGILAQMLKATGNTVGARARVEEILAEDATNTEALKLRAGFLIAEDKPGEAIVDLRTALSQNPRDAATLTLMAEAHERDGSLDLAGERLAAAVEVSNKAPAESLRYARFLMRQGRGPVAEAVLTDSRAANPADIGVLGMLADIWLAARDWGQVAGVVESLRALKTPEATQAALALQATLLQRQDRAADSLAFLEGQVGAETGNAAALALMVQTQVRAGKPEEARRALDAALEKTPDDGSLQMLSASLNVVMGDVEAAETGFRKVIAENPGAENPVRLLYGLLVSGGRAEDAAAVLAAGLAAQPGAVGLRLIQAGALEKAGDVEGAIAVYDALYTENSGNVVVANNLASLISTHRSDPESLERAAVVARRLRGSTVPAFQDTYGWIAYRQGNLDEALTYLEPAAAGLPGDPLAQFHLGMTYAGLNRPDDARKALENALQIAGDSPLPQFQTARDTLAGLPPATTSGTAPAPAADPAAPVTPAPAP